MAVLVEADAALGIDEVVVLVDVECLVLVSAVGLLVELVVAAAGLVVHVAVLHVGEHVPRLAEVQRGLQETAVVELARVGVIVFVAVVGRFPYIYSVRVDS